MSVTHTLADDKRVDVMFCQTEVRGEDILSKQHMQDKLFILTFLFSIHIPIHPSLNLSLVLNPL